MKKKLVLITLSLFTLGNVIYAQKMSDQELFDEAYEIPKEDIKAADMTHKGTYSQSLYSIEKTEKETKVTFLVPIYWDSQWLRYQNGYKIVDRNSGDEYHVRGYDNNYPTDRLLIVKGFNGRYIFITLVFPPLNKDVKYIDIISVPHKDDKIPSNNTGINNPYYNIKVEDYLVKKSKEPKIYR